MRLIGKVSQYDKIVAYLKNPESDSSELTLKEQEMLARWDEAFTLLRNYNSTADAAAILMKRFPGLSRATAYRDCASAISLFGDISQSKKEGIKHLTTEIARDAIAIARIKNNEDGMLKGAKVIADINGVNTTDPDLPDFSKLESHTFVLGMPEEFVTIMTQMISGGKIDLTQMVNNMVANAEDAVIVEGDDDDA